MPFVITASDKEAQRNLAASALVLAMKWELAGSDTVRIRDNAGRLYGVGAFRAAASRQTNKSKGF